MCYVVWGIMVFCFSCVLDKVIIVGLVVVVRVGLVCCFVSLGLVLRLEILVL